ncbi:MAG: hypothetical protein KDB14_17610, partial [Planctomycetales bacterium]|nr:hypothetical protein [Planctomycetales bacterium]
PGRIDRTLYLGPLEEDARVAIAARILPGEAELQAHAVRAGDGETAAQFQERCARMALRQFWESAADVEERPRHPATEGLSRIQVKEKLGS